MFLRYSPSINSVTNWIITKKFPLLTFICLKNYFLIDEKRLLTYFKLNSLKKQTANVQKMKHYLFKLSLAYEK